MTLAPFPGFRTLETHHCVTGSMLQVFRYHGVDVSEEMLLGLGAGVGFLYWHQKGVDPFIGGRTNVTRPGEEGLEITASRRLGVVARAFQTTSTPKAEKTLRERLQMGDPVMLRVDMGYLPYFDFGGEEYHFGYHVIVVAGFDPQTRQVLVADRDLELHPLSWEDLTKARGSTFKPFPPKNGWYTFDFNKWHLPVSEEIRNSIQEVVDGMLDPPISNLGVKGIRKAAGRILKWPDVLDLDALRRTCFNTFVFIDALGGTGGGIFRYMYGRFLKEAAVILGIPSLVEIGDRFKLIGDCWQDLAQIFKRASEIDSPAEILPATSEPFLEIALEEEQLWQDLRGSLRT